MKKAYNFLMIATLLLGFAANAQVTTSTIRGVVQDDSGGSMPGATVVAVHTPSGTEYGTVALANGTYVLPNLRVGGPYTVTISSVGFQQQQITDIYLALGRELTLDIAMATDVQQLKKLSYQLILHSIAIEQVHRKNSTMHRFRRCRPLPVPPRTSIDSLRLQMGTPSVEEAIIQQLLVGWLIFNNPFGLDAATPADRQKRSLSPSMRSNRFRFRFHHTM